MKSLLLIPLLLASCTLGLRNTVTPEGSKDTMLFAQLGGKGQYATTPEGGMVAGADNEKSFGAAVTGVVAHSVANIWGGVEKAKSADAARTAQTATKADAAVQTTRITETGATVRSVGNNPEANVGAIEAVKGVLR